jgi:hypothetical protein
MATVNLGSIKFKWKGTYAGGTAYTIDDVVSYNGSSYICIQASTGNLPTDTAYFEQMSQKGSDGTNGTDGTDLTTTLTTQGDILYRDGSGLARLGAGTSGQFLKTQGASANPTWGDVTTDHSGVAWFEYLYGTGQFGDMHSIAGYTGAHDRGTIPFNSVTDPYNIIGTTGSNTFEVNSTGMYEASIVMALHVFNHHKMFLYNDTDGKYAERPNTGLTGTQTHQSPMIGYNHSQGQVFNMNDFYYLETGHTYSIRGSNDGSTSAFSTSTSQLLGNHTAGGVNSYNTIFRTKLTKMSGV